MKKIILIIILILVLMSNVVLSSEIKEYYRTSKAKAYAPAIINVFEPYTAKIVLSDPEKGYDLLGVSGSCDIALEHATGLKKPMLDLYDSNHYKYNGEKEFEIVLSQIQHSGSLDLFGVSDDGKNRVVFYPCTILLKNSSNLNDYSSSTRIEIKPEFYPYFFGIDDLPDGFNSEIPEKDTKTEIVKNIYKRYSKESDNQEISLSMKLESIRNSTNKVYSYEELSSPEMDKFNFNTKGMSYEEFQIGNEVAHMYYSCDYNCKYYGFVLKSFGPVVYNMKAKVINRDKDTDMDMYQREWKDIFKSAMKNTFFKPESKNLDIVLEKSDDDFCGDCKTGYVCGACGKCIKESKAIDPSKVQIQTNLEIKNDGKKILNSIESNLALTVYPNLEIKYNGENVDYCDLKDPGIKMNVRGELIGNDTYSGFTSGFVTDERESYLDCEIDFKDRKPNCVFIVSPNSRKKFIEKAEEVEDEYRFTATINNAVIDGERKSEKIAKIIMTPPDDLKINLNSRGNQVQQGNVGVLEIKPSGGTTEDIVLKVTLLGPGEIGLKSDKINTNWLLKSVKQKEKIKVGYRAPALGNFDIGKELESLSMKKLQIDAAKQIALDAVTAYGGEYVDSINGLVDAGKYSSKIGKLTDAYKVTNGGKNIIGTDKAIKDMTGELGDAMQVTDGKSEATWAENAADVGIIGISAAQTAIGVLTFIPNKIPGVNKLSAGVQSAFSAATNIWKANLQYISKSEKIERAKELYYPVVILVTAQDVSGWTKQEMHVFQIAYHQIR